MGLFKLSISLVSVLVVSVFLGVCPFFPDCPICWHITAHNTVLSLFLKYWWSSLLFYSWLYFLSPFLFIFYFCLGFISFVNSLREPAPSFVDLFYWPVDQSISLISALIGSICLLPLVLGFIHRSFFQRPRGQVLIVYLGTFLLLEICLICKPLRSAFAASQRLWTAMFSFSLASLYFFIVL